MSRILVVPDMHIPSEHPRALEHCIKIYEEYGCDTVIFLGDIFDLHRASFHEHDPQMPSLADEIQLCIERIRPWVEAFPTAMVCESNHDSRIYRVANKVGIPAFCVKDINTIFGLPDTWTFQDSFILDNVRYSHGMDCKGGAGGMYQSVAKHRRSQVYGHWHSFSGIQWSATDTDLLFGFNVGCMVDINHLAMRYGKWFVNKPIIGCGVVIDGNQPHFIPLDLGSKIKYEDNPKNTKATCTYEEAMAWGKKFEAMCHRSHEDLFSLTSNPLRLNLITQLELINEDLIKTIPAVMVRYLRKYKDVSDLPKGYQIRLKNAIERGNWN